MIWVRDVPNFEWVLIHCGNSAADTSGCLLLGSTPHIVGAGMWWVERSRETYVKVYPRIRDDIEAGHVSLSVLDRH